ncbi:LysR family transcriptional regulator [Nonomuraea sp. NPDC050556]|uniref:LysR family transcriptional regulator n=1 Tax=Nonomuraea sp. NPDC050556 TaxID=3364369 RepID=UPI0037934FB1
MERHEIEAFLTLAEELHFGRTAERLRVTHAHISQTIKKLERRIGGPLFARTSRRVALTPLGEQLNADLAPAYSLVRQAYARAVSAVVLRAGFVGAAMGALMRQVVCGSEVQLQEIQFGAALTALRSGAVEVLGFCFPINEPDLVTGPVLLTEPTVLAVPANHPLAKRGHAYVEDLAAERVVSAPDTLPPYWADHRTPRQTPSGRPIDRGPSAATFQEILMLIASGQGVYPVGEQVTHFYRRADVTFVPLVDAPPLEWGLIWRRTTPTSPRLDAFVKAASGKGRSAGRTR